MIKHIQAKSYMKFTNKLFVKYNKCYKNYILVKYNLVISVKWHILYDIYLYISKFLLLRINLLTNITIYSL